MSDDLLPLETLDRLSRRQGIDTRPILIRVLTDLFVQKQDHSAEEIARYEELARQLLDVVGVDARAAVARKLAGEPRTPRALIDRLIADEASVSTPILSRFPDLPRATLIARALDGGPSQAAAIASRADVDAYLVRLLARHPDEIVLQTLVANEAVRFPEGALAILVERAGAAPALAAALLRRSDLDPCALAPLYLQADPVRRAGVREALAARRAAAPTRSAKSPDAVEFAIETAAASIGQAHLIADALGEALSLAPHEAARLATEASGEPFVLMLRASGVEAELATRALLIAQPDIAMSVARVFDLVEIAETTPRAVAAEIVTALVGRSERTSAPRHEPLFEPSGVMERAGAARPAPARRPNAGRAETRNRG